MLVTEFYFQAKAIHTLTVSSPALSYQSRNLCVNPTSRAARLGKLVIASTDMCVSSHEIYTKYLIAMVMCVAILRIVIHITIHVKQNVII